MNIPMTIKPGHDHPTLNDNVYKGKELQTQARLYHLRLKVANDPELHFQE
jgi:hypothetical protein